jgi:hypothetical protein
MTDGFRAPKSRLNDRVNPSARKFFGDEIENVLPAVWRTKSVRRVGGETQITSTKSKPVTMPEAGLSFCGLVRIFADMGFMYERLIRPVLFRLDPEVAHERAVEAMAVLGALAPLRRSLEAWAQQAAGGPRPADRVPGPAVPQRRGLGGGI